MEEERSFCPICKKEMDKKTAEICRQAREFIIKNIKRDHPEWVEKDGACPKCVEYYEKL